MLFNTAVTQVLNIRYPILAAPMANISGGKLARAVTQAGGLGFIGAGYSDEHWLQDQLHLLNGVSFGIGFITWHLRQNPSMLECALRYKPLAVMLSFGDIEPFVDAIKTNGSQLICQIQTVKDALKARALGADIIVAQGSEAGGHGATRGTFALVPAVVDAVAGIPVIAAGGIADGRGLAAALMLGASGVLVGTRFYACHEALGHARAKQCIVDASGDDTIRSNIFDYARGLSWPAPYTARSLTNDFTRHRNNRTDMLSDQERHDYHCAQAAGDFSIAGVFAGECVDLIHEISSADAVISAMVADAQRMLRHYK